MGLDWIGIEQCEDQPNVYFSTTFRGKVVSINPYLEEVFDNCHGSNEREGNAEIEGRPTNGYFLSQFDKVTIVRKIREHLEKCRKPRSRTPSKKYLQEEWQGSKERYIKRLEEAIEFLTNDTFVDIYCWF
eukprot:SAG31_NODE_652_length_13181_cov_14.268155_9_plen_130_part_00